MVNKEQIVTRLNEVLSYRDILGEQAKEGDFNKISVSLVALQNVLREAIQSETSGEISKVIRKLESDGDITDADMELIRVWIASDAEFYVQMENDYPNWLEELNRLFSVIEQVKAKELKLENLGKISGTARDALRVIADIVFFKQQQGRINNFENASKNLSSDDKLFVADILKRKLESDEM
jgi:hypothetical protein